MQSARSGDKVRPRNRRGFTLVELMIAVSIIAVLSGIAIPLYASAVHNARIVKCKEELRVISRAIDVFRLKNHSLVPATLDEVGFGTRVDPWGNLYMFLNFQTGTGSGMEWAIKNNLADPAALMGPGPGAVHFTNDPAYEMVKAGLLPIPILNAGAKTEVDNVKRKDRFLFPLNTDYDLFSFGSNGKTAPSLGDPVSLDDVIRANDGGYFGLADDY